MGLVRWERGAAGFGSASEADAPSLRLAGVPSCSLGSGGEALLKARLSLGAVTVLVRLSSPPRGQLSGEELQLARNESTPASLSAPRWGPAVPAVTRRGWQRPAEAKIIIFLIYFFSSPASLTSFAAGCSAQPM